MWSKPFLLKNQNDETVAVLLVDTNGFFNCDSSGRNFGRIFALSSFLASVQVCTTNFSWCLHLKNLFFEVLLQGRLESVETETVIMIYICQ